MKRLAQLSKDKSGTAAIEYALLAALIALVAIDAFTAVGTGLTTIFTDIAEMLDGTYVMDFTTTSGTYSEDNGLTASYTQTTSENEYGQWTNNYQSTDTGGNTYSYSQTWQNGSNQLSGSETYNGTTDTFTETQSDDGYTKVMTNSAGQTATQSGSYNASTGVSTFTQTNYDGSTSSWTNSDNISNSSTTDETD